MRILIYSTSALKCFVAAMLKSGRTFMYACGSALLDPHISVQKRISENFQHKRVVFVMLCLLSVSGCGGWRGYHSVALDMTPPDGPEIYQQGWLDGCKTGIAANTNDFYKIFTRIQQDPEGMKQEIYRRVWQDAYNYCWFHTSTGFTQPI